MTDDCMWVCRLMCGMVYIGYLLKRFGDWLIENRLLKHGNSMGRPPPSVKLTRYPIEIRLRHICPSGYILIVHIWPFQFDEKTSSARPQTTALAYPYGAHARRTARDRWTFAWTASFCSMHLWKCLLREEGGCSSLVVARGGNEYQVCY